jgi:hypothetical protein
MNILNSLILLITLAFIINGCAEHNKTTNQPNLETAPAITEQWLGTWYGPEGTSLKLSVNQGEYVLSIQNLDGPRTFDAIAINNQIQFERDGHQEFIIATDGAKTGMKWLSEKSNCLTIRYGEGYCRD